MIQYFQMLWFLSVGHKKTSDDQVDCKLQWAFFCSGMLYRSIDGENTDENNH